MQEVRIPQNVRVEDKLIGPLSLKQIILIAVGGGFSYVLMASIQNSVGTVPPAAHGVIWLPAVFAAAFALVKINDISLFRYCLLVIEKMSKPRQRVWRPRQGIVINIQTRPTKQKKKKKDSSSEQPPPENAIRLEDLSTLLDRHGTVQSGLAADDDIVEGTIGALDGDIDSIEQRIRQIDVAAREVARSGVAVDPLRSSIDDIHTNT